MKIMDVTEFYSERGGVRGHLDLKGQILRQAGHHHLIVAPGPVDGIEDLPLAQDLHLQSDPTRAGSARVLRLGGPTLPYDSNYHLLWRIDRVRRIALREKPDVLEINSPYLAPLVLRGLGHGFAGVKTFWWHADFIDTFARAFVGRFANPNAAERWLLPLWGLVRSIGETSDATFAAGAHQVEKLAAHGVPRVVHLPFGVDKEVFCPGARSEAWRSEMQRGLRDVPIVVAMGRLAVEKDWPVVLEGFVRASRARRLMLLVFGDGPERARLASLVKDRADVRFMGFERDRGRLAIALASADAFVHGCPYETFGLSVAQAIASGLPLVVPDRGGAAELADPSFSEYFRSGDAQACGEALLALLGRGPERLRLEAIARRDRICGAEQQVAKTVEVYAELIAARARRQSRGARS
jgi:alpha-1,6-mannosyltransferase